MTQPSDCTPDRKQRKYYRITIRLTVDVDCSHAVVDAIKNDFDGRDVTVEVSEKTYYDFRVEEAVDNFLDAFRSRKEPAPIFKISELGSARILALAHMAERGFATIETLCHDVPNLSADKARAAIRDLLHHGKISRMAKGVYYITNIGCAYHDEIVEFRLITETLKSTRAEIDVLRLLEGDIKKDDLVGSMGVSRQWIDQLLKRLIDKGLATVDKGLIRKTTIGDIVSKRTSQYPL